MQDAGRKLALSRTVKLTGGAAVVCVTMVASSWGTFMALVLLFLILVRCTLKNDEVAYLRNHKVTVSMLESPLLKSAFTATTSMTHTVSGFADNVLLSAMRSATKRVRGSDDGVAGVHTE